MGPKHAQLLNWKGNSTFILVIIKLWDMLNIKSYGKGIRLRKSDASVDGAVYIVVTLLESA